MFRRWWAICSFCAVFILSKAQAGNLEVEIESALSKAGDNRSQIQAVLDKAPAEQLEGMRFLIANMPERDLRALSSDFLLTNADYAYKALNQKIFPLLKVRFSADRPKANQSPYETIEANRASCTGLSVLLIDACRAVGVPARFVGTPLWTDNSGNHSWVEIWDGNDWQCTGAAEPTGDELGQGWFVGRAATAQRDDIRHAIYAVRYEKSPQFFPAAWSRRQDNVYAVNVTDRYTKKAVKRADGEIVIRFRALEKPNGQWVAAKLKLTDSAGKIVVEGTTHDDRFDPNDHLEAVVAKGAPLKVELRASDHRLETDIQPQTDEELFTYYLADAKAQSLRQERLDPQENTFAESGPGQKIAQLLAQYFDAAPDTRSEIAFDSALDKFVLEQSAAVRKLVWKAYLAGDEVRQFQDDLKANRVSYQQYVSPYVVRAVGAMPAAGWPLFIAMHGGGGAPAEVNDSQWQVMQHYYRDQPSTEGYLYLAIRAPNNIWNGFYDWYNLCLTDRLIREFVASAKVDPNKVFIMGYSHGGYGAFFQGPRMADRFAAVHVSAAAPSEGNEVGKNLRNTPLTFMVGEHDTAYGRLPRCQEFDKFISGVRGDRNDIYPVKMEYQAGFPHSGLPDRDKIKDMYAAVRNPVPREITWLRTHEQVKDFYWLRIDESVVGQQVDASCDGNVLTIKGVKLDKLFVDLDERLVDYAKPLKIEAGESTSTKMLEPSLRTLCETLAERGDPESMSATRLSISLQLK